MNLLLTASGCPGASTLIKYLRKAYNGNIKIIGTDSLDNVVGKILCDKFYVIPQASEKNDFINKLKDIVIKEKIEAILPQSTIETFIISKNLNEFSELNVKTLVSDYKELKIARNKYKLYEKLKGKIPLPKYYLANTKKEFNKAVFDLGYPDKTICFKPPIGEGSRGFRIISPTVDRKDMLLNQKPNNKYMTLKEINEIFNDENFPQLLVMEFINFDEYDAMTLCIDGEALLTTVKTRERERNGVITYGELIDKPEIIKKVERIIKEIPLKYSIGIQFIGDYLIEINPRVSTFIYQDNLIEPYYAIELAMGNISKSDIRKLNEKIKYGRKMIRYMDQIFFK